jgi:release factor glutamine methyltransferase
LSAPSILDIGTGSGNIAVALARNAPGSHITGVDINREALQLAAFNSEHNSLAAQIKLVEGDILDNDFVKSLGLFDLVVSNPPYVAADEGHKLQPEITMFEPASALFCGQDPLKFFKTIIGCISYILKAGGYLAFEAGFGQPEQIVEFMKQDFKNIEIVEDLAGLERVVVGTYARSNKG